MSYALNRGEVISNLEAILGLDELYSQEIVRGEELDAAWDQNEEFNVRRELSRGIELDDAWDVHRLWKALKLAELGDIDAWQLEQNAANNSMTFSSLQSTREDGNFHPYHITAMLGSSATKLQLAGMGGSRVELTPDLVSSMGLVRAA